MMWADSYSWLGVILHSAGSDGEVLMSSRQLHYLPHINSALTGSKVGGLLLLLPRPSIGDSEVAVRSRLILVWLPYKFGVPGLERRYRYFN